MNNNYKVVGDIVYIDVEGNDILIDFEDLDIVLETKYNIWLAGNKQFGSLYAYATTKDDRRVPLHRLIMNAKKNEVIDHINHNTFDNRKNNLRKCTHQENMQNRKGAYSTSKTGIRGVHWNKQKNKWKGEIWVNYKKHHVGFFDDLTIAEKEVKKAREKLMPYSEN